MPLLEVLSYFMEVNCALSQIERAARNAKRTVGPVRLASGGVKVRNTFRFASGHGQNEIYKREIML